MDSFNPHDSIEKENRATPFLRWAGGKRRLTPHLLQYIPGNFGQYWEPFLGSGAMFFSILPSKAHLSDINADLICCFKFVRDFPEQVFSFLETHLINTSKEYYYFIRDVYNKSTPSIEQAARFIYLNKTSFNGIFRVNTKGEYNVPYGYKEPPALPSLLELTNSSKTLKSSSLNVQTYEEILMDPDLTEGDFVYLDPPYPPINGTAYFTHYTAERFAWEDQERVAEFASALRKRNCLVMISNSDQERIRKLYQGWNTYPLPVVRWIAANGSRKKVSELVITSY